MPSFRANLLGNYALFLEDVRQKYDLAESYYRRALQVEPDHPRNLGNYAVFLETVRNRYDQAETLYGQAVQADPTDPDILGNYAGFLEQVRKDYDRAEGCYRQACAAAPDHFNNLTNYATFLTEVRGEHDQADELYSRALAMAPDHRNTLGKYAIFLTDVRHDYAQAEVLYHRGLQSAPENPAMLANLAGLLYLQGKDMEGAAALETALGHLTLQAPSADAAECWFYRLVYGEPDYFNDALMQLRLVLDWGVRSPGWRLAPHVERAKQAGHPYADWLSPLAAVIVGEAPVDALRDWPAWG